MNPRLRALHILDSMLFNTEPEEQLCADDSPFVSQLVYGVLRFYPTLKAMLSSAMSKKLGESENDIHLLLVLGLYQLKYLDIAPYAIVQETVEVAQLLKKTWAKGLINAILRRFLREPDFFERALKAEEAKFAHPKWFIQRLKNSWPNGWESILKANNEKGPMHIRVNASKISREEYLKLLPPECQVISNTEQGICLAKAQNVDDLPGFREGLFSVQDAASQRVVDTYLDLQPGFNVLDACAAPGGKTAHCLEKQSDIKLLALDICALRCEKIHENLSRLSLLSDNIKISAQDALDTKSWWNNEPFHRILLDAPCSSSGVIRRHPEIKYRLTDETISNAVERQKALLHTLWPLLIKGGKLVYSTCSVWPEENEKQVKAFLKSHPDATLLTQHQAFPGESDGFFYAVLEKC